MKLKTMTLLFDPSTGTFNDEALLKFQETKVLIDVSHHFFIHDGFPYITFVILYREPYSATSKQPQQDPKKQLNKTELKIFEHMASWRKMKSGQLGLPPYQIFTNKQLVQIIQQKIASLTKLSNIKGLGSSRVEKYGKEILQQLKKSVQIPKLSQSDNKSAQVPESPPSENPETTPSDQK